MPIHDLGYRHWTGELTSKPYRWWVITRRGIGLLAKKRSFLVLMALSAIPFLVRAVLIYFSLTVGKSVQFSQINAKFFADFLTQQEFFTFIITIYAGAGLISNDLKANALQIYLSKPITRQDYLIGKLGVLIFFLALPTLLLGMLLFILAILFQGSFKYLVDNYWILAAIFGYSLFIIFTYGLLMLGLSSVSKSSRFAGISFAAIIFFSEILGGILNGVLRTSQWAWISLNNNLTQVGNFLFQMDLRYNSALWISLVVLLFLMAGAAWTAYRRVRAVELVS